MSETRQKGKAAFPATSQLLSSGFVQGEKPTLWLCRCSLCMKAALNLHSVQVSGPALVSSQPHAPGCTHLFVVCFHGNAHLFQVGGLHVRLQFAGNPSSELAWWKRRRDSRKSEREWQWERKPGIDLDHRNSYFGRSIAPDSVLLSGSSYSSREGGHRWFFSKKGCPEDWADSAKGPPSEQSSQLYKESRWVG